MDKKLQTIIEQTVGEVLSNLRLEELPPQEPGGEMMAVNVREENTTSSDAVEVIPPLNVPRIKNVGINNSTNIPLKITVTEHVAIVDGAKGTAHNVRIEQA